MNGGASRHVARGVQWPGLRVLPIVEPDFSLLMPGLGIIVPAFSSFVTFCSL